MALGNKKKIFLIAALYIFFLFFPKSAEAQVIDCDNISINSNQPNFYILKVSGLIDPVIYNDLINQLNSVDNLNTSGVVIWLDSEGGTLNDQQFNALSDKLYNLPVETGIWIGNSDGNRARSSAVAYGQAAELTASVDNLALAPGSSMGDTGDLINEERFFEKFGEETGSELKSRIYDAELTVKLGISQGPLVQVADIKQFIATFDSYETIECETDAEATVRKSITPTQISGLTMIDQLFHSASSPSLAYLFLVLGISLIIFEFFTAGIGVAGTTGAVFMLLGGYGMGNLPVNLWAIVLLLLGFFFIGIDIQTNVPKFYSALGLALYIIGSIFIYRGTMPSYFTLFTSFFCAAIYIYSAMPAMVRARFSTPTIGRSWMIGKTAIANTTLDPEGQVKIDDVPWKAVTNRATPIKAGDLVKVTGINRLILEVEPETGAAKDYRK